MTPAEHAALSAENARLVVERDELDGAVQLLSRVQTALIAERDALKEELERAVAIEREACAKVCADLRQSIVARGHPADSARGWIKDCEDAIRARGAEFDAAVNEARGST